jgi:hypothetical protein
MPNQGKLPSSAVANKAFINNSSSTMQSSGSTVMKRTRTGLSDNEDTVSLAPTTFTSNTTTNTTIVQELMANTALTSVALNKERKDPPLNLLSTTPRNFTRFVSRLGPVVDLFDAVTDIMTWKDPPRTLVALLAYIILCMYNTELHVITHGIQS